MIFIDSNMWCYYFDQRLPEHKHVREHMREIIQSEEIACNTIVIIEVAHYLVRNFNEETARKKVTSLVNLRNLQISDFDRSLMRESLESLLEQYYTVGLGGRDATIVATLKLQNIHRIVTHDAVFKRLAPKVSFEVIDPIHQFPKPKNLQN